MSHVADRPSRQRQQRSHRLEPLLAAGVGLLTFAFRYSTFPGFPDDQFVHLARAQQWLFGSWPVRDFVDPGFPLMYGLSALAQVTLGRGLHAEVVLTTVAFGCAAALLFVAVSRLTGSRLLGLAAAATITIAYPASYGYVKLLPFAAALAVMTAAGPARTRWLGALTALAFLLRHDLGVVLGTATTLALLVEDGRAAYRPLLRGALVGLGFLAPFLVWVQWSVGIPAYFASGVAFSAREGASVAQWSPPRFRLDRSRPFLVASTATACGPVIHVRWAEAVATERIPDLERRHALVREEPEGTSKYRACDASRAAVEALVRDPAVADTQHVDRERFRLIGAPGLLHHLATAVPLPGEGLRLRDNSVTLLYYLAWILPCAAIAVLTTGGRVDVSRPVVFAVALQLLMNVTMLRDPLDTRIRDVLVPASLLLAWLAGRFWVTAPAGQRLIGRTMAWALVTVPLVAAGTVGALPERIASLDFDRGPAVVWQHVREVRSDFSPPNEHTGTLDGGFREAVTYLRTCSEAGARFLSLAFVPGVFFYTERGFAGGQATMAPGFYTADRDVTRMLARLAREDVPFVLGTSETWDEMRRSFPRLRRHVDARYRETTRFELAPGKDLIVLSDTGRPVERTFGDGEWPCFATAPAGSDQESRNRPPSSGVGAM